MNGELIDFTRSALAKEIEREEISRVLAEAGWPSAEISSALSYFADIRCAVPVPRPKPYMSAREVFLYLLMFSFLYDCCYHLGALIFDIIDKTFPDATDDGFRFRTGDDSMRWNVANLIVGLPLFLFMFNIINKAIMRNPIIKASRPRKWLTYLTLFIATMSLACDIGTLVYNMLGGELTRRFVFKVATVAAIAGSVLFYFLRNMRAEEYE